MLWKKIDPSYIPSGLRIDLTDETPIATTKEMKKDLQFSKEYGTISEFYFLMTQMIHFGLLHTFKEFENVRKMLDRLTEEKKIT